MANTDAAMGFKPYENVLHAGMYAFVTEYATAVYHQDLVELDGAAYTTIRGGQITGIAKEETGAAGSMVGSILALFDSNMDPVAYLPASTVGDGVVAGFALVADDPMQLFVAQEDGVADPLDLVDVGMNVDAVGTGGNTSSGISTQEIDSSSHATTATLALRLIGIYGDDTPSSANSRWIVRINSHAYGSGIAGV